MFLIPTHIGQALLVLIGVLFFPVVNGIPLLPLVPSQVLWVNLVTGITLAYPLAFENAAKDIMQREPRTRGEPILGKDIMLRTVIVGAMIAAGGVGLFLFQYVVIWPKILGTEVELRRAQTMVATTVVLFQVFYLFQCRSRRQSIFRIGLFSNNLSFVAAGLTILLQSAFVYVPVMNTIFHSAPIGIREWLLAALIASAVLPAVAIHKAIIGAVDGAANRR
jgi:magnesium-transporting ATPase (P-type)